MGVNSALLSPEPAERELRIVIVDDDPTVLETLKLLVDSHFKNVSVVTFQDGDDAWRELSRVDPDLLMTDINHPGLNGSDMLTLLGKRNACYPIFVVSGSLTGELVRDCHGLNVSFFAKPFAPTELTRHFSIHLARNDAALSGDPVINETPPVSSAPPSGRRNYFARHWRGELSLGVSYWINGIFAQAVIVAVAKSFGSLGDAVSLKSVAIGCISFYLFSFAMSVWQIVGTWRSASNHVARGGQLCWAGTAKVVLVLSALTLLKSTVSTTVPQITEFAKIIAGDTGIPKFEVRVLPGGSEIEFRGGLRAGSAKELERIVNAVPQAKVLHLNSGGGRISEGEQMARIVRERGLITYTSERCLSAATLVFLAGKERVVSERAKLGFHSGSFPGMTAEQRRYGDELIRQIMRSAKISDDFINHVLATPPSDMWYPSVAEMRQAGVITGRSYGERFAVSGLLLRSSSPKEIDEAFSKLPGYGAIKDVEPTAYWQMVNGFCAAIQSGKSEAEAQDLLRQKSDELLVKYLPQASDEALLALRDLWVELLERFKDKDSRACVALFSTKRDGSKRDLARLAAQWSGTNNLTVIDKVLRSKLEGPPPRLNAKDAKQALAGINGRLSQKFGDDLELLAKEDQWLDHSREVCEMLWTTYRETKMVPKQGQGNLLRYMLRERGPWENYETKEKADSRLPSPTVATLPQNRPVPASARRDPNALPPSQGGPVPEQWWLKQPPQIAQQQPWSATPFVQAVFSEGIAGTKEGQAAITQAIRLEGILGYDADVKAGMSVPEALQKWGPKMYYPNR